jgi:hypothetical protein
LNYMCKTIIAYLSQIYFTDILGRYLYNTTGNYFIKSM